MNPGCSLVDLLLFPIYFQFRKNKGNKTVWPPPPSIVHLVEPVNAGLRHRLKKTLSPTNEMKVGAKRKKQDEQADIRLFFRR